MKKTILIISALTLIVLFSACGQKTAGSEISSSSDGAYGAGGGLSVGETGPITDTADGNSLRSSPGTDKPVPTTGGYPTGTEVYVGLFEQDSLGARLSAENAEKVCEIIGRYRIDRFSWDNISDYTLVVNGTFYSYDSGSGIITKDDTHADMLSDADRIAMNEAIGAKPDDPPATVTGTTVTDTFVIERVSGTHLELRKVVGGEVEDPLYSCDYGRLDGADEMKFSAGDRVRIRYDREVAETYPMQITVREIQSAD